MKPNVFISYSRRELGFVDELALRLEKDGFNVWLDYRSLIPGSPWSEQIQKGIDGSDVIVLVVSRDAIASKNVELEWHMVIQQKKRIILAIFEAVDLPPELEQYEWVDFRGSFTKGLKKLKRQIETPEAEERPAPETGFKIPFIVWLSILVSIGTAFLSIYAWWTILLPFLLVPLPYHIFKRDYVYTRVQAALWMLPLGLLFQLANSMNINSTTSIVSTETINMVTTLSLFICPLMIYLLSSKGMQRWGKPGAIRTIFKSHAPGNIQPEPVSFHIDFAPQDRYVANALSTTLEKHGHKKHDDIDSAQAVFVLVSSFKTDTQANPEKQVVFPILVQSATPSEKLSKVQWIDFRNGMHHLESVAKLLHDPANLLRALGIRPAGNQLVLPAGIQSMVNFLAMMAIFTIGAFTLDLASNQSNPITLCIGIIVLLMILFLIYKLITALIRRQGRLASIYGVIGVFVFLGILYLPLLFSGAGTYMLDENKTEFNGSMLTVFTSMIYVIGTALIALYNLLQIKHIWRWFPSRS